MLFQGLSAKLGIVTGRNLAEMSRDQFPQPVVIALWIAVEIAAIATDLAEFVGGAIGLSLLFNMPLFAGMVVTGIVTYGVLLFEGGGFRPVELVIGGLVAAISLCYLAEMFIAPVDWSSAALHSVLPQIPDAAALTIAVGIIGATVMPHAIYLHSGLTQNRASARDDAERRTLLRFSNVEVVFALAVAGLVNMAMIMMASAAFHQGHSDVAEIGAAYHSLAPLLGGAAATVFLISLLASGVSSSAVGTMAGQLVMQGFVGFRIPLLVRRLVTMVPAFVVVALGVNATNALVISQVVLSIVLPVPMISLVMFTRRRDIMGAFVNSRLTDALAILGTSVILALNLVLLAQTFGVAIPGLPSTLTARAGQGAGKQGPTAASVAAIAVMLTMPRAVTEGVSTCAGLAGPMRIGPIGSASAITRVNCSAVAPASRLGKISTFASPLSLQSTITRARATSDSAVSACISPSISKSGLRAADELQRLAHLARRRRVGGAEVGMRDQRDLRRHAEAPHMIGASEGEVGDFGRGGVVAHVGVGEEIDPGRRDHQRQRGEIGRARRQADDVLDVFEALRRTDLRGRRSARRPRRDAAPARRSRWCWCAPACAPRRA